MFNHLTLLGMISLCAETTMAAGSSTLLERMRQTSLKAGPMLPLTKEKFELITFAMEMNYMVEHTDCENDAVCYQDFYGDEAQYLESSSGVDANLLIDVSNYCFVSWRATLSYETWVGIVDWRVGNFDVLPTVAEQLDGQGRCLVHGGMYGAYEGDVGGKAELEPSIISFVETCMAAGSNKQLVLVGHSQGGAAALIGSIRFAEYNPLTIPLAGPAAVISGLSPGESHLSNQLLLHVGHSWFSPKPCTAINPNHVWRVINTELDPSSGEITYDLVPFSMIMPVARRFLGKQIGASIHLPPDIPNPTNRENKLLTPITFSHGQTNVAYFSKNEIELEETYGPFWADDMDFTNSVNRGVHLMYLQKLNKMLAEASFPLNVDGYVAGTPCKGDAECEFFCINDICSSGFGVLPDGASCAAHDDCASGDCSGCALNFGGDWCCTGGDSDHGSTPNGGACEEDGNCESDRCTYNYVCEAKLESGTPCGEWYMHDGDCASGECSYKWWKGWRCE